MPIYFQYMKKQRLIWTLPFRLIIAACLAIPAFGALWLRSGNQTLDDAGRGANQEYKRSAEGNKESDL